MIGYASLYIHMHNNAQESSESVWKLEQNSVTKQLSNVFTNCSKLVSMSNVEFVTSQYTNL